MTTCYDYLQHIKLCGIKIHVSLHGCIIFIQISTNVLHQMAAWDPVIRCAPTPMGLSFAAASLDTLCLDTVALVGFVVNFQVQHAHNTIVY